MTAQQYAPLIEQFDALIAVARAIYEDVTAPGSKATTALRNRALGTLTIASARRAELDADLREIDAARNGTEQAALSPGGHTPFFDEARMMADLHRWEAEQDG